MSMWTSLFGPVAVITVMLLKAPMALPLYFLWVAFTRYIQALMLFTVRRDVTVFYPFILYFNQIFGSIIKVFVLFDLERQKWTRQNTTSGDKESRWKNFASTYLLTVSAVFFAVLVGTLVGALPVVDPTMVLSFLDI